MKSGSSLQLPFVLIRPSSRWSRHDLQEMWEHRELLYFFVWRDLKIRYKRTVIGAGWAVIQPFFAMVVFSVFFGALAKMPSEGVPYPLFSFAGLLPWMYFANALAGATTAAVQNERIISKVHFPKLFLPAAPVTAGLVDLGVSFLVFMGMMIYYGAPLRMSMLALPLFVLLAALTAFSCGIWLCALNVLFQDVRYAVPFLIQFWLFASPVAYPSSLVPEKWRMLYGLNPMAGVLEGFRWALLGAGQPPGSMVFLSILMVLVVLGSGLLYFRHVEDIFADVV
ncbi:MAG: ABC transporter permease [Acidobacteria bacterium]|nr:ABC transporter permease [Acidobacteriota bacterium]